MNYLIVAVVCLFVLYKVLVYLGRKNAIDVLCHNYQLDPDKVGSLKDTDITRLHLTLESMKTRAMNGSATQGELSELTQLLEQYK